MSSRKQRKRRKIIIAATLAGALLLAIMIPVTLRLYSQKKAMEAEIAGREYGEWESSGGYQSQTIEYQGKTYRRNSYVKAILCMGVDRQGPMTETTTHTFGGQADSIFVIAQDTARNTLKVLMIPRDTMTEITLTDLSGNVLGKEMQHLTLAYAYGDGREESCESMMEAVQELLNGVKLDHYLAADIDVVAMLNDMAGGVTVTIPVEGMEERDPELKKGATVTLMGGQAETFVRYRDKDEHYSAIDRMERQQQYIAGFFQAVQKKSREDSQVVTRMFDQMEEHMVTDMAKDEYLKIAMDALNSGDIASQDFYTLPGQSKATWLYDEYYVDQEAMMPVLLEMFYREVS